MFKLSIHVASRIATDKTMMTHDSKSVFLEKLNFTLHEIGSEIAKFIELWGETYNYIFFFVFLSYKILNKWLQMRGLTTEIEKMLLSLVKIALVGYLVVNSEKFY